MARASPRSRRTPDSRFALGLRENLDQAFVRASPCGYDRNRRVVREHGQVALHVAYGAATQDHVEARKRQAGLATDAVVAARVDVPAIAGVLVDGVTIELRLRDVRRQRVVEAAFAGDEPS